VILNSKNERAKNGGVSGEEIFCPLAKKARSGFTKTPISAKVMYSLGWSQGCEISLFDKIITGGN